MHGGWASADGPRSVNPVAIPPLAFCGTSTLGIACEQSLYSLVVGLFTQFIFLSRRGAYHFAHVFFCFSFLRWWFGMNWQALGKCCGSAIMDLWQPFIWA